MRSTSDKNFHKAKCILLSAIIWSNLIVYSQEDFKNTVIRPSPTSAVFNRYGNDQPSLQTGTVNIPISLFNIEEKGLRIPISLTYQTSGITVFDTPYPAGYGWVFNPSFRITRVIFGRHDEDFLFNSNPPTDYEIIKRAVIDESIANLHQYNSSDLFDTQKDIFTLHMPSGSYNFFLKKVGSELRVVSMGHQIRIIPITGPTGLMGFEVTDAYGIIYMFGYSDPASFTEYTEPAPFAGCTSWMLREITLVNKQKMHFSWQKVNTNAYSAKVNTPISIRDRRDADPFQLPYVEDLGGIIDCSTYSGAHSLMIKKIEFSKGVVEFNYKSSQDPFLQDIAVKDNNNNVIKAINLHYGINVSNCSNRLLTSLEINGEEYKFTYNDKWFGELTTALDYWGYYNGKTNNMSLIPQMTLKIFTGVYSFEGVWPTIYETIGNADRSVSAEDMQAFMLTKIVYPTGGYSTYEYEPHQFAEMPHSHSAELFLQNPSPLTYGGGLRVYRIKNYSSAESVPLVKTFKYGTNEDGVANIQTAPTLETFIEEIGFAREELPAVAPGATTWWSYRQMNVNAISHYSKYVISKSPIWYSTVTEYINNDLKTSYACSYNDTYDIAWELNLFAVYSPYVFRYDNLFNNGPKLISTTFLKKDGENYLPVEKVVNEFERLQNIGEDLANLIIDRNGLFYHLNLPGVDLYPPTNSFYPSGVYPHARGDLPGEFDFKKIIYNISVVYDRLKRSTTTRYNTTDSIELSENYFYNDKSQISKVTKGTSETGKELTIEYKYSIDYNIQPYEKMVNRNILAPVIEETSSKDSNLIKKEKINYFDFPSLDLILQSSIQIQNNSSPLEVRETFNQYDLRGNLFERQKANDFKQSYIWDYNNTYPIAEAINSPVADIAYTSFESDGKGNWTYSCTPATDAAPFTGNKAFTIVNSANNITKTGLSTTTTYIVSYWKKSGSVSVNGVTPITGRTVNGWTYYEHKVVNPSGGTITVSGSNGVIDELRLYPAGAQMTTYTYAPLIGMTSQCDVNNRITYYQYDDFGRLMLVRDQDKNIIKKICYNYAGQPEQCTLYESDAINDNYDSQNCPPGQNPIAYHVSVPQGMFTSYVDQQTANQLAEQYAQDQADQYGSCQIPDVSVYGENNHGTNITIQLHNVVSGQDYYFTAYSHDAGTLGDVPPGTYDITLTPNNPSGWYNYSVGCGYWSDGPGAVTFYGVSISSGCSSILID